jgi:hypothetical protein
VPGARLLAAVGLAAVLTGCGGGAPTETADAPSTTTAGPGAAPTTGSPDGPPAAVPDALRFTAEGVDGSLVVGADYAGRDVALWFWAPW